MSGPVRLDVASDIASQQLEEDARTIALRMITAIALETLDEDDVLALISKSRHGWIVPD